MFWHLPREILIINVGLLVLSADCNAIIIVAFLENTTIEYSLECVWGGANMFF